MFNRRDDFNTRFERSDRSMRLFGRVFMVVWVMMFIGIMGMFALGAWLSYQCYASQDPNSFACWYASDRVEIGVRQR
jgi:hypothetical protein